MNLIRRLPRRRHLRLVRFVFFSDDPHQSRVEYLIRECIAGKKMLREHCALATRCIHVDPELHAFGNGYKNREGILSYDSFAALFDHFAKQRIRDAANLAIFHAHQPNEKLLHLFVESGEIAEMLCVECEKILPMRRLRLGGILQVNPDAVVNSKGTPMEGSVVSDPINSGK